MPAPSRSVAQNVRSESESSRSGAEQPTRSDRLVKPHRDAGEGAHSARACGMWRRWAELGLAGRIAGQRTQAAGATGIGSFRIVRPEDQLGPRKTVEAIFAMTERLRLHVAEGPMRRQQSWATQSRTGEVAERPLRCFVGADGAQVAIVRSNCSATSVEELPQLPLKQSNRA